MYFSSGQCSLTMKKQPNRSYSFSFSTAQLRNIITLITELISFSMLSLVRNSEQI